MILETVKSEGLAQLSYVVGDEDAGVAAVIDPRRDVGAYLEIAQRHGLRIEHVLETHIHADFVSGSLELRSRTGATVHAGRSEAYEFCHRPLDDGDTVSVGAYRLTALHTPGHSPEHVCFLLSGGRTEGAGPWAVFTGDTLFAGSVGRPDLSAGIPAEELARALYRSIHEKLLPLGDDLLVYPGHAAGSPCGSGEIGDREVTTIGYERRTNDRLGAFTATEFADAVLKDLPEQPRYYTWTREVNASGPATDGIVHLPALDARAFREAAGREDAVIVDVREAESFSGGHVPGSLNIGLRPAFPVWAGWMLDPGKEIFLVVPDEVQLETVQRHLHRIGLYRIGGWLRGGMHGWIEAGLPLGKRQDLSVHELRERVAYGRDELQLLDVRSQSEWDAGRVPGARHVFAPHVGERADEIDPARPVATFCATGYRGSLAASVLAGLGFDRVHNVAGSMEAWRAAGYPLADSTRRLVAV